MNGTSPETSFAETSLVPARRVSGKPSRFKVGHSWRSSLLAILLLGFGFDTPTAHAQSGVDANDCETEQCVNQQLQQTLKEAVDALRKEQGDCRPGSTCWSLEQARETSARQSAELTELTQQIAKLPDPGSMQLVNELHLAQKEMSDLQLKMTVNRGHAEEYVEQLGKQIQKMDDRLRSVVKKIDDRFLRQRIEQTLSSLSELKEQATGLAGDIRLSGASLGAQSVLDELQHSNELLVSVESAIDRGSSKPPGDPYSANAGRPGMQLLPDKNIRDYYGDRAALDYLVVTVPDPRVPRLKRNFDLVVAAITRAFAQQDYLFDRYYYPWSQSGADYGGLPDKNSLELLSRCNKYLDSSESEEPRAKNVVARRPAGESNVNFSTRENRAAKLSALLIRFCRGEREFSRADVEIIESTGDSQEKARDVACPATSTAKIVGQASSDNTNKWVEKCKYANNPARDFLQVILNQFLRPDVQTIELPKLSRDYGIITFRRDCWRVHSEGQTDPLCDKSNKLKGTIGENSRMDKPLAIYAIYLVADRPSNGVQPDALFAALNKVTEQESATDNTNNTCNKNHTARVTYDEACKINGKDDAPSGAKAKALRVIGPSYSGSVGTLIPILDNFAYIYPHISIVGVSPVATAADNNKVQDAFEQPSEASWRFPAPSDDLKATKICEIAHELWIEDSEIAVFAENSTWGRGSASSLTKIRVSDCADGKTEPNGISVNYFPPNLWETRIDQATPGEASAQRSRTPDLAAALRTGRELRLDADIGSEYPPSYSQYVTARTAELELDESLRVLKGTRKLFFLNHPPKLIVMLATDVRDQLFLARRIRSEVPGAVLVVPESDVLLSHPDYLDATRGMRVLSSAPLSLRLEGMQTVPCHDEDDENGLQCERFAKDDVALYYAGISNMVRFGSAYFSFRSNDEEVVTSYIVSRSGLVLSSGISPYWNLIPLALIVLTFLAYCWSKVALKKAFFIVLGLVCLIGLWLVSDGMDPWYAMVLAITVLNIAAHLFNFVRTADSEMGQRVEVSGFNMEDVSDIKLPTWAGDRARLLVAGVVAGSASIFSIWFLNLRFVHPTLGSFSWLLSIGTTAVTILSVSAIGLAFYKRGLIRVLCDRITAGYGSLPDALNWVGASWMKSYRTPFLAAPEKPVGALDVWERGQWRAYSLRNLLGTEIRILLYTLASAIGFPIAGVLMVWATPIGSQNLVLSICLGCLVIAAGMTTYMVVSLERSDILSRLFCGRDAKMKFTPQFVLLVTAPIAAVAITLAVYFAPGVKQWSDTLILPIFGRWLGFGG